MQALVQNFRGIVQAEINISPIALLCGHNGAGKTSMARAISAAATGKGVPWDKVTKKDSKILLRNGSKAGKAVLGDTENNTMVSWPGGDVASVGNPPHCSEIAAGIVDLLSMEKKQAIGYLINVIKAAPTIDDVRIAFEAAEIDERLVKMVWDIIAAQGWDEALKRAKETGTQKKGAWSQITGQAWGDKKALEWFPEGWDDNLLSANIEGMQALLADTKIELSKLIGDGAVSAEKRKQYQEMVDLLPEYKKAIDSVIKSIEKKEKELGAVEDEIKKSPNPDAKKEYACPHCDGAVNITATSGTGDFLITKAGKVDATKLKEARIHHAELCGKQGNLQSALSILRKEYADTVRKNDEALEAKNKLEAMPESIADNSAEIAIKKAEIDSIEKNIRMLNTYNEATKIVQQIAANKKIIEQLEETGIRHKKLSESMDTFIANYIEPLCIDFGIPIIDITADLEITLGTVTYHLLSASEQFRVRTVIQMAIAKLENAQLIIIDGADILDTGGRSRLMNMVVKSDMKAIICMTLPKISMAPDLKKAGYGQTYWVEGGTCIAWESKNEKEAA